MPVSSTVTVPFGRAFTSNNPGGRWSATAPGVTLDSEFAASGTISLLATVIRQTTWWIQFTGDLELLPNIEGARNDLVVTLTHPSAGTIVGDISSYQTAGSRDGTVSQATITARDSAAQATWGTAVSDDTDALSIVLSSATSGPAVTPPPTPTVSSGIVLGGKNVTTVYVGDSEVERVYVGDVRILGDAAPPPPVPTTPSIIDLVSANTQTSGLWSDGTTMWVADFGDDKLYAYTLSTGARDAGKEFDLHSDNSLPVGLWSDGTTMWVLDSSDEKVYAYTLATGARDAGKEFDLVGQDDSLSGLWSDGTTMWMETGPLFGTDTPNRLLAYTLATGARDTGKEFNLASANSDPRGVWSDGTTMWVVDTDDDKLYAYTLSTGARDAGKEFDLASANSVPQGIWSDGTTMWVADSSPDKIYPYRLSDGTPLFPTE